MSSSEDIVRQFQGQIPGMATGQNAVAKVYVDDELAVRDGAILTVAGSAAAAQNAIDQHEVAPVAHPATAITYAGVVDAGTVEEAIDKSSERVEYFIANSGNSVAEIVNARAGEPQLNDRLNNFDAQLAETVEELTTTKSDLMNNYAKKTDVGDSISILDNKINSQASGSPKGVYATVTALVSAFPTGNANIYLVSADGKWYYWSGSAWAAGGTYQTTGIADNSVSYHKIKRTSDTELSDDLSVGNKVPDKYVHNSTGALTNYPNTTTGGVTGFIPVSPGEVIRYFGYTNLAGFVGWIYNSAQQPLVTLTSPATASSFNEMTMPTGAAFIRVNYAYVSESSFSVKRYQLEKSSIAWLEVEQENILNDAVTEQKLSPQVREKLSIPLQSIGIEKLTPQTVAQLQTTEIEPGGVTLDKLSQSVIDFIEEPSTPPVNPFDGDTSVFVGDSITQGTGTTAQSKRWADIVVHQLSFSSAGYQNLGVGGSTVAKQSDGWAVKSFVQRVCDENQIASNRDRIFVLGGVNDFVRNTPLSTQDAALSYFTANGSWDDFTFYGALNRLIRYIRENHNDAELVYVVPMHYELENTPNGAGLKMKSYINAIREVCEYYAVPIIDLWASLPIDPKNAGHKAKYTLNGSLTAPDGIHPNDLGNAMIAGKVVNFLKYQYIVR